MVTAIKREPLNYSYGSQRIKSISEIIMLALSLDVKIFKILNKTFRYNETYLLKAIKKDGNLIINTSKELRSRKDLFLIAIEKFLCLYQKLLKQ
jgi:hypothetical protein